jgi:hypothetical protein
MTDVDPRDFMDFYLVKVSSNVFAGTSMERDNFDEAESEFIYSTKEVDGELYIEFTT